MTEKNFTQGEHEWFANKPRDFVDKEVIDLQNEAIENEKLLFYNKNLLLNFLNNYSNEIPDEMMTGMQAKKAGKKDSKYRPNYIQGVYLAIDGLMTRGVLSTEFEQFYNHFKDIFDSRRQMGDPVRTTEDEINNVDKLIKMALKELKDKGY